MSVAQLPDEPTMPGTPQAPSERVGAKTWILVTIGYIACVAIATYPHLFAMAKGLPGSLYDPLQHLWIVKWYRTCLLEWRSPVVCPELQYPVGAPLGNFSPLHFQALLFLPLSFLFDDVVCFNLIWLTGIITTGLGTFLLIWHILGDRRCAAMGGMMAMLSGPMLSHARAHLELIFVGCFPLFLVCWMRLIDAPSRRRLIAAVGSYVLVALCAAYYVIFAVLPAVLYLVWKAIGAIRHRQRSWFRSRAGWLSAFAAMVVPILLLVFGNQLWTVLHGYSIPRPLSEFNSYGTPIWTYFTPSVHHPLSALLPVNIYYASGMRWDVGEKISYLGVVMLLLIFYAATANARFRQRGFWWALLAALVVLSNGSYWEIGTHQVPLPALWLKKHSPLFEMIRVPARFNLFVGVAAAVVAAAGLRRWLDLIPRRSARAALVVGLTSLALFDLSNTPYPTVPVPDLPAAYEFIRQTDPDAGIVEVPQWPSGGGSDLASICGYWQSLHHLRTNAGYSGHANLRFDNLLTFNSPFRQSTLERPDYLTNVKNTSVEIINRVNALDYIWLYLHANRFRYVVLHEWPGSGAGEGGPLHLERLKALLAPAQVFAAEGITVYDREKIRPPRQAVPLTTTGWRLGWYGKNLRVTAREAKLLVYNPEPEKAIKFVFEASAFPRPRTVRLLADGKELASWRIASDPFQLCISPGFRLPAGIQELVLESDGETKPRHDQRAVEWDDKPYSLRVSGLALIDAEAHDRATQPPPPQLAAKPEGESGPGSEGADETRSIQR